MTLLDALRVGHASAQGKKALAEKMGTDTRTVEAEVQAARLRGVPVCSDADGYWLASTAAEVAACADALRRRYISQVLTARALRRAARRMEARERAELTLWAA